LPCADDEVVELDDLVRFVQHPVRAFLRRRLGVSLGRDEEEPDDGLPVELDALAKWEVGQRLVEQRLAGHDLAACIAAERARGTLPPGHLGAAAIDEVVPTVEQIVAAVAGIVDASAPSESIDVDVDLGGMSLFGTVNDVVGDVVRAATYSRVGPKHRLAAWVRLLAVSAGHAAPLFSAATIGRGRTNVGVATIAPIPADTAIEHLRLFVDLHTRGMREPLPLYCDTSHAYAAAPTGGRSVRARKEWTTTAGGFDREDRDAAHVLVLGDDVAFDDIERPGPAPDECGPGWHEDVDSRFGRCALRLWEGLLAAEQRSGL
jgi:exodeoxyribonuclease V gamma subunit